MEPQNGLLGGMKRKKIDLPSGGGKEKKLPEGICRSEGLKENHYSHYEVTVVFFGTLTLHTSRSKPWLMKSLKSNLNTSQGWNLHFKDISHSHSAVHLYVEG